MRHTDQQLVLRRQQGTVLALALLEAAIGIYLAMYQPSPFSWVLLAAAVVAGVLAMGPGIPLGRRSVDGLVEWLLIGLVIFHVFLPYWTRYEPYAWLVRTAALAALVTTVISTGMVRRGMTGARRPALVAVIALGLGLHVVTVLLVPLFWDVAAIGEAAGRALLEGRNPYLTHVWHGGYPYLPISAIASALGLLVGDVRWPVVAANGLVAVLFADAGRRLGVLERGLALGAIWVWTTGALFVTGQAFYDGLIVALAAGALVVFIAWPRRVWVAGVLIGVGAGLKQFGLGFIPYLPVRSPGAPVAALAAVISAVVIVAPFVLWDASALAAGTAFSHIREPARAFALNLLVLPDGRSIVPMPLPVALALAAVASWWAGRQWIGRRWADSISRWLAGSATLFLVAFVLNGIAFVNYYLLVIGAWLMLLLVADRRPAST
jgi:hypothetical protein